MGKCYNSLNLFNAFNGLLSSIIRRRFTTKIINVDALIKLVLTTTTLMLLMTNRMLSIYDSVIGVSCCGKSTLDVGVMSRPSKISHIHRNGGQH